MKKNRCPRPARYLLAMLLSLLVRGHGQAVFVPLGDLPGGSSSSLAYGVSGDGTTVVGSSDSAFGPLIGEAFRWTPANGMVGLGTLPDYTISQAKAVSGDGAVVVGWSQRQSLFEAFRWTETTGMVSLGSSNTLAWGVSADGATVVGQYDGNAGAFRWTASTGLVRIGNGSANGVSADGAVVVGGTFVSAFRWTPQTGQVSLGFLPGANTNSAPFSAALGVSPDGAVAVGYSRNATTNDEAFRWTQGTGMVGLGDLPGGQFSSIARAVSAEGSVIVGDSVSAVGIEAFVWDQANGMRSLRDLLIAQEHDLADWQLRSATGVSADGSTIVGWGLNPSGQTEGWLAVIPEPSTVTLLGIGSLGMLACRWLRFLQQRKRQKRKEGIDVKRCRSMVLPC